MFSPSHCSVMGDHSKKHKRYKKIEFLGEGQVKLLHPVRLCASCAWRVTRAKVVESFDSGNTVDLEVYLLSTLN